MSNKKTSLFDWLGLTHEIDFTKAKPLGSFFGLILLLLGVFFVIAFVVIGIGGLVSLIGAFIGIGTYSGDPTGAAIRNIGLLVVAVFGAPLLVWRSIVAQKQVDVSEQGQITDRINKAVEGLGAEKTVRKIVETPKVAKQTIDRTTPNLEVRIGAIYALERIAQDSMRDHIQIMEILCAYVRENAPAKSLEPTEGIFKRAVPRTDIQTAITVIGRRSENQVNLEREKKFRLDLRNSDFSGIDFKKGNFSAALFHFCRIEKSDFSKSSLKGTQFDFSLLNYTSFFYAELRGTIFDNVTIDATLGPSILSGNIYGISIENADISAIRFFAPPETLNNVFGSHFTKLHDDFANPLPIFWAKSETPAIDRYNNKNVFLKRLKLNHWPYKD